MYAGGKFTKIGVGEPTRNRIAAICATNDCEGAVEAAHATAWNPNANAEVSTLTVSGSTVYAGGLFTTIVGTTRNYVASLNASGTAALNSWNANANDRGCDRHVQHHSLPRWAFSSIGGVARTDLAAICATNDCEGSVEAGHPHPGPRANNEITALALSGSTALCRRQVHEDRRRRSVPRKDCGHLYRQQLRRVGRSGPRDYVEPGRERRRRRPYGLGLHRLRGGAFTTTGVGAPTREHIAALCATNNCEGTVEAGHATAWAPSASATVNALRCRAPPSMLAAPSRRSASVRPRETASLQSARQATAKGPSKPPTRPRGTPARTTK